MVHKNTVVNKNTVQNQRSNSLGLNFNELSYDLAILSFLFFITQYFKSPQFISKLTPLVITAIFLVFAYCLPWYMGAIYWQYQKYVRKDQLQLLLVVFVILILFVFMVIVTSCASHYNQADGGIFALMLVLGIVLLMLSCFGVYFGSETESQDLSIGTVITLIILSILAFFGFIIYFLPSVHCSELIKLSLILMSFFGTALLCVGLVFGAKLFKKALLKLNIYKALNKTIQIVFPFILATFLLLFSNLNTQMISQFVYSTTGRYSPLMVIWMLTISGVLPFRIILMLTPPVRFLNIVIGSITFCLYIHYLMIK